mgnify:CR=1 FL=1
MLYTRSAGSFFSVFYSKRTNHSCVTNRAHGKVNPLIVMRMMADVILRMVDDKLPLDEAIQPYRFFGSVTEPEGPEVFLGQEVVEALRLLTSHIEHDLSEGMYFKLSTISQHLKW